ncbi:MAG TPA: hypothetical protein VJH68_05810 [Candidatus Nanoarchaeia archaeon]|nr:hypothetical protein [Candidatus Nanoarchaeia archaeon]
MAVETIVGLTEADRRTNRRNLIRECLQNPRVSARRCNAPTAAALIDNAIYSVEEALRETPQDFSLKAAYEALQVEYPQHFYSIKNNLNERVAVNLLNQAFLNHKI